MGGMARLAFALLAFTLTGCGASDASSQRSHLPALATSSKGTYLLEATTPDGADLERGLDVVDVRVARASDGMPAAHLTIAVKPWMPAMGHGAPPANGIEQGAGHYRVASLSLYMPGLWQLRTTLSPGDEDAVLELEVR